MKEFQKIGKVFKAKSGKSGVLVLSEEDLTLLSSRLEKNDKYGNQVSLLITGSPDSQYGYSVSLFPEK